MTALVARLVCGGQSGADRAALDVAVALGIEHGGWCPAGGWAEDRPEPPGVLPEFPGLRATPSADPRVRTHLNVRDSHATLLVEPWSPDAAPSSPGTEHTVRAALRLGRPLLRWSGEVEEARQWLRGVGLELTLHVAGPRESERPGLHAQARLLLHDLLRGT